MRSIFKPVKSKEILHIFFRFSKSQQKDIVRSVYAAINQSMN